MFVGRIKVFFRLYALNSSTMAYEKPITIKEAIEGIQKKKYVLPSIQREFVWEANQIEKLFDSLMRDYPISTFLFWNVEKVKINEFQFYEFLQHYHERDATHNPKASLANDEDVIAILDGQQRLTSLYIQGFVWSVYRYGNSRKHTLQLPAVKGGFSSGFILL
jgi:hypothetical protein